MIEPLREKLVKLILDGIDRDRKGESVSQTVLVHKSNFVFFLQRKARLKFETATWSFLVIYIQDFENKGGLDILKE